MLRNTFFLIVSFVFALPAIAAETSKSRMLMVTQSAGYRHGSVTRKAGQLSPAEIAMTQLGQQTGLFDVDCTQDVAADFTKKNLERYDLVTFYTSGDLPIAEADLTWFLKEWMHTDGHGFLGFHSATDTYKKHSAYRDFVGGAFDGHPWGAGSKVIIKVHETQHPAMRAFPELFAIQDEIYQYTNWQPEKVRVLMSLDMGRTRIKRPYHVPIAWVKQIGKGRMFYTNLGHRPETWQTKPFLQSVTGAVRWLKGIDDGSAEPNPKVSAAHHTNSASESGKVGITMEFLEQEARRQEALKRLRAARKTQEQASKKQASEAVKLER